MQQFGMTALVLLVFVGPATPKMLKAAPNADALIVRWPLENREGRVYQDDVAVVEPERAAPNAQPTRVLLTYAAGKIEASSPSTLRSIWPKPIDCPYQPRCLLVTVEHFICATSFELFAVDRRSGVVAWRLPVTPGSHDAADLVDSDRWMRMSATDDAILAIDSGRHFLCIDSTSGRPRWQVERVAGIPEHIDVNDRYAYCLGKSADATALDAVALADGRAIGSVQLNDAAVRLIATPFGPVLFTDTDVIGFDAEDLREQWRHTLTRPVVRRCFSVHGNYAFWLDGQGGLASMELKTGRMRLRDDLPLIAGAEWLAVMPAQRFSVVGNPGMLVGVDLVTGSIVWRHSGRALPFAQPPIVVGDALIVVNRMAGSPPADNAYTPRERLLISRVDLRTGMSLEAGPSGDIMTAPVSQFRGLTIRNDAILLLDGPQLIGYVSTRVNSPSERESANVR